MKKGIAFALAGLLVLGLGCEIPGLTDSDDDGDDVQPTSISELSMGGIIMSYGDSATVKGYVLTMFGDEAYSGATVYLNGTPLTNSGLFYQNDTAIPTTSLGDSARISIYALGDSAVFTVAVPNAPVIQAPLAGAEPVVGDSLQVTISYPGTQQSLSMILSNQPNAYAVLTTPTTALTVNKKVYIANAGEGTLIAAAVNATGTIPSSIDYTNPTGQHYEVFVMASLAQRTVTAVANAAKR